jgi:hypothetical protein
MSEKQWSDKKWAPTLAAEYCGCCCHVVKVGVLHFTNFPAVAGYLLRRCNRTWFCCHCSLLGVYWSRNRNLFFFPQSASNNNTLQLPFETLQISLNSLISNPFTFDGVPHVSFWTKHTFSPLHWLQSQHSHYENFVNQKYTSLFAFKFRYSVLF